MSTTNCLFERYRPKSLSEVVGQGPAVKALELIRSRNGTLGGQCYFIAGKSGTGKSTIAKLIANEVTGASIGITELYAGNADAAFINWAISCYRFRPIGANGFAFIVNEVHRLDARQVGRLLDATEPDKGLPSWVTWCFTTTVDGQEKLFDDQIDAGPFTSRCKVLPMTVNARDLVGPFSEFARKVAQTEQLDGRPLRDYVNLFYKHDGNLRRMLQDIEQGAMLNQ